MFPASVFPSPLFPAPLFPMGGGASLLADPIESVLAAWQTLELDDTVGPIYLNQPTRGIELPYVVLVEVGRPPYFSPRSQRGTQHDLQVIVVAEGEAEAVRLGTVVRDAMEGATLAPTAMGNPYSIVRTDGTLLRRPAYGWAETRATAALVLLYRVRVSPVRQAS
jgi:hypothetical protein